MDTCKEDNCTRPVVARKLCNAHYLRAKKGKAMNDPILKKSRHGSGHITKKGYRRMKIKGYQVMQHRYIVEQHLGRKLIPNVEDVHHINGDKLDNRLENLELVAHGRHTTLHRLKAVVKNGKKLCLMCGERRPLSMFYRMGKKQDGTYSYYTYCDPCSNAKASFYHQRRTS